MRTVAVVTTARADYGIWRPVLRHLRRSAELELALIVGGMHLLREFGSTVGVIERDGFAVRERVNMLLASDTPDAIAVSMGLGTMLFAGALTRIRPDLLLVLGDRFEMHAAAVAAVPLGIPIGHVHGGELTEGAIDDAFRHSISKFAHLHFPATERSARRLERMGEEPWRITVAGAPSLDNLREVELPSATELTARFGVPFDPAPLLVTLHPVTREGERTAEQIAALLDALERVAMPVVFTLANADSGGRLINERIAAFVTTHANAYVVENFATDGYFGAMNAAAAMVGNSSSGIIEAASFRLPVVNLGSRQAGRDRAPNVIDVPEDGDAERIAAAILRACTPAFRDALRDVINPYGDGRAAERIVARVREVSLGPTLLRKSFHDA